MPVFLSDTFAAADGTLIESHIGETGAAWTRHPELLGDGLKIQSGRLVSVSTGGACYASGLPAGPEYVVEADAIVGTSEFGILGRCSTTAHTWYELSIGSSGTLYFRKRVAGAVTTLGTYATGKTAGQTARLRLEITDAAKNALVDGVQRLTSADNAITAAGRVGLRCIGAAGAMDNVVAGDILPIASSFDSRAALSSYVARLHDTRADISSLLKNWMHDTRADIHWQRAALHDSRADLLPAGISFYHPAGTVNFSRAPLRPPGGLDLLQAERRSAAGVRFAFDPLAVERPLTLHWPGMAEAEAAALEAFFYGTVNGMAELFIYRDAAGVARTVYFAEPRMRIEERAAGRCAVTVQLLEVP